MTKLFAVSTTNAIPTANDTNPVTTGLPTRHLVSTPLGTSTPAPALPGFQMQVLFETGRDELPPGGRASILLLAELLRSYPQLLVRLEGHTDSRGTDEYNNVLSDYRARSVADCLISTGIDGARIERSACGSSRARAGRGDLRGYALERRVTIEVYQAGTSDPQASPLH